MAGHENKVQGLWWNLTFCLEGQMRDSPQERSQRERSHLYLHDPLNVQSGAIWVTGITSEGDVHPCSNGVSANRLYGCERLILQRVRSPT
jgi:hypothetical protein